MTLDELNALDSGKFADALGRIFENSRWVAERAWNSRPFASLDGLHQAMVLEVERGSGEEQLALLRAHPDLGTRAKVSDASAAEQAGAGLDRLTQTEFEELTRLNAAYRQKFGFPFLYAVKGSAKHEILRALQQRTTSTREQEYDKALRQVHRIARFRLEDFIE